VKYPKNGACGALFAPVCRLRFFWLCALLPFYHVATCPSCICTTEIFLALCTASFSPCGHLSLLHLHHRQKQQPPCSLQAYSRCGVLQLAYLLLTAVAIVPSWPGVDFIEVLDDHLCLGQLVIKIISTCGQLIYATSSSLPTLA
jgi:hypothetical protein